MTAGGDNVAKIDITDKVITLTGPLSIIGRTMVVRKNIAVVNQILAQKLTFFHLALRYGLHMERAKTICLCSVLCFRSMRKLMIWEKEAMTKV